LFHLNIGYNEKNKYLYFWKYGGRLEWELSDKFREVE
jgi:hypothetical protein